MTSGQALLVKLAKLVKELLQKLPYWWKLPIVLMMFYQIRQRDYLLSNNLFDAYSSQHTGPKYDCQDPLIGKYYYIKHNVTQEVGWGARDGAEVRELASHQRGPGSNPVVEAICGLRLLLVLSFVPRGFSPGTLVFPSPQKPTFANSNSIRNQVDEEPLCGCATSKSSFIIYLFIYLNEKILLHIITYPLAICVRDGRKKTVETWLSIRERKAEGGSSKDGSRKGTK